MHRPQFILPILDIYKPNFKSDKNFVNNKIFCCCKIILLGNWKVFCLATVNYCNLFTLPHQMSSNDCFKKWILWSDKITKYFNQFSNFHFCQYFRAGENGRELQKGDKYDWKQETVWPMGSDLTKYKLNFVEQQKKK